MPATSPAGPGCAYPARLRAVLAAADNRSGVRIRLPRPPPRADGRPATIQNRSRRMSRSPTHARSTPPVTPYLPYLPYLPCLLGVTLIASLGCAKVMPDAPTGAGGVTGAGGGGRSTGVAGATGAAGTRAPTGSGGTIVITLDGGSGDAACTPSVTCTPAGGRYCGTIGNGCPGGRLECGDCPASDICSGGVCVGGPSCM